MAYKEIAVGADRFLALKWSNFAFNLCRQQLDEESAGILLREYLDHETTSAITSRKTTNQLRRLWLAYKDEFSLLRAKAIRLVSLHQPKVLPVLHLGMAVNVFPVYRETVSVIGVLNKITSPILSKSIVDRVLEKFPNPSSIPYTVPKILRTLKDWGLIDYTAGKVTIREIELIEEDIVNWFLMSILMANEGALMTLKDLEHCPYKLGIHFAHLRQVVYQSKDLLLSRNAEGGEVISLNCK